MIAKDIAEKYSLDYEELATFLASKNIKEPYDIPDERVINCVKAFQKYEAAKNAPALEEVSEMPLQPAPARPVQQQSYTQLTPVAQNEDNSAPKFNLFSFTNIGKKIKTLAKVICILGAVVSFIMGIVICVSGGLMVLVGLLTMVVGIIGSYIGCFCLYGYGELIDKTMDNNERIEKIEKQVDNIAKK